GQSVSDKEYHAWLVDDPAKGRPQSTVAEVTPRVRALHPRWSISYLNPLVQGHVKVRISGWLMMDQEHPEQIGQYRATLWELHPIMGLEVWQNGAWTPLDSGAAPPPPGPQATPTTAPPPPAPSSPPGGYYEASASVSS